MKKGILYSFFMLGIFIAQASATHIVAGYSHYNHISAKNYEINFTLVNDQASGLTLDNDIIIQVFTFDGLSYNFESNIPSSLDTIVDFDHGIQNEFATNANIRLTHTTYSINYELAYDDRDYIFVYQRCCRSEKFSNILDPGQTGFSIFSTITVRAQELQNSSIEFDLLPTVFAKINADVDFPINATSVDGDTLAYQISPIYVGGGTDGATSGSGLTNSCSGILPHGPCFPPYDFVGFNQDLNFYDPFPAWDNAGMDGQTGDLTGTPQSTGQYSYGFTIHETRSGEIINSTNFDYILFVLDITNSVQQVEQTKIKVLGNPSPDIFSIQLENQADYKLEVFTLSGRKVDFNSAERRGIVSVDIAGPSGVYILKAYNQNYSQSIKLIKL